MFSSRSSFLSRIGGVHDEVKDLGAPPCDGLRCSVGIGERIYWVRITGLERRKTKQVYLATGYHSTRRARSRLFHRVFSRDPVAANCVLKPAPEGSPASGPRAQPGESRRGLTASRGK